MSRNNLHHIFNDITQAILTIRYKWFHSLLSILGVVISVTSIIVMISISEGTQQKVLKSIKELGMHTIRIDYKPTTSANIEFENLSMGLLEKDFKEIEAFVGNKGVVSHAIARHNQSILTKRSSLSASLYFADNHFLDIEKFIVTQGRPILYNDIKSSHNVAVVSDYLHVKENLDIGDSIVYEETAYRIVGISTYSDRLKNFIYLPLRYTDTLNPDSVFDHINIYWFDTKDIVANTHELTALLKSSHKGIDNFQFTVPLEIVNKKKEAQRDLDLVLFIIALMSLLTGGISIMNIMLSNISEQTREIGLKLALGATQSRIIRFVLIHTMLLTFFAALIGALAGYAILLLIVYNAKIYIIFSMKAFMLAFIMAMVSGIVFGIYPAIRASNITPMTALKEY